MNSRLTVDVLPATFHPTANHVGAGGGGAGGGAVTGIETPVAYWDRGTMLETKAADQCPLIVACSSSVRGGPCGGGALGAIVAGVGMVERAKRTCMDGLSNNSTNCFLSAAKPPAYNSRFSPLPSSCSSPSF